MKINFHFQHRSMRTFAFIMAADKLLHIFRKRYPEIEFEIVDLSYMGAASTGPYCKFKDNPQCSSCLIIENPENKKYFLISYMDKLAAVASWDLENCVEIFATGGVHMEDLHYNMGSFPYTPISPPHVDYTWEIIAEEYYRQNLPKIMPEKPFFMSQKPYLFRKYIHDDPRFDSHISRVTYKEFVEIIGSHSIVIDINSVAEISNRTVDAFSLGCALLRPKYTLKFHNDLIPDFHYAVVKCNDLSNYKELADAYIERFEELKKDKEMARFLSINGRKWYEENATLESHVNILNKVINIEKLF